MKRIILFDATRKELGDVRIDSTVGRIEANLRNDSSAVESALNEMLTSIAEDGVLFVSKAQRQNDMILETREKITLKHPQALNALADAINRYTNWPQRIFAVIQNREEA